MKTLLPISVLLFLIGCSNQSTTQSNTKEDSALIIGSKDTTVYNHCFYSDSTFFFQINGCSCSEFNSSGDTIFVSLDRMTGGEVQGQFVKIINPICDKSFYILSKYQNRFVTSSMGPDPILTDWILYNSVIDTIRFQDNLGFYIDTIPTEGQEKFPKFDTLDFYRAYKRNVEKNLSLEYVPNIAKNELYREYKNRKKKVREILEDSYAELHRIILTLKQYNSIKKVIVFTYWHVG